MIYAKNLPGWERMVRMLLGAAAIAFGLLGAPSTTVAALALAAGVMIIATSLFGFCPACAMIGRRSVGR